MYCDIRKLLFVKRLFGFVSTSRGPCSCWEYWSPWWSGLWKAGRRSLKYTIIITSWLFFCWIQTYCSLLVGMMINLTFIFVNSLKPPTRCSWLFLDSCSLLKGPLVAQEYAGEQFFNLWRPKGQDGEAQKARSLGMNHSGISWLAALAFKRVKMAGVRSKWIRPVAKNGIQCHTLPSSTAFCVSLFVSACLRSLVCTCNLFGKGCSRSNASSIQCQHLALIGPSKSFQLALGQVSTCWRMQKPKDKSPGFAECQQRDCQLIPEALWWKQRHRIAPSLVHFDKVKDLPCRFKGWDTFGHTTHSKRNHKWPKPPFSSLIQWLQGRKVVSSDVLFLASLHRSSVMGDSSLKKNWLKRSYINLYKRVKNRKRHVVCRWAHG